MEIHVSRNLGRHSGQSTGRPGCALALANKRYPDQSLPHKELFFNADLSKLGPEVKKQVNAVIRDQLIPEYVASNIVPLMAEVRSGTGGGGSQAAGQGGRTGRSL